MSARLLDGHKLAARLEEEMRPDVAAFTAAQGRPPGLAIVLAGDDPASKIYVNHKVKAGEQYGFRVDVESLAESATMEELLAVVARLNTSDAHDGILVQAPLPAGMGAGADKRVFDAIAPEKDVDAFGARSVGLLVQNRPALVACTPQGIVELLVREGITIAGARAVVVGRSDIIGKPMALLLLHRDATVTIAHSKTRDLRAVCREADILVAAAGQAALIEPDFVKPGATVVDVGINRVTDPAVARRLFPAGHRRLKLFEDKGSVIVGDVHPGVEAIAGALTPVPGGVGPLTIAMLMRNTLIAARERGSVVG